MDEFERDIVAVLAGHPGIGIFSTVAEIPGRGRVRHWFSLAVGLGSLQAKTEYRERFRTVPEWVLLCHPYHQMRLCSLALRADRSLPAERPEPVPGAASASDA